MSGAAVWVDVSAALDHHRLRVHGVTRFILETAQHLAARSEIRFFRLDPVSLQFREVERNELAAKYSLLTHSPLDAAPPAFIARTKARVLNHLRTRARLEQLARAWLSVERALSNAARKVLFDFWRNLSRVLARAMRHRATSGSRLIHSWSANDVVCHLGFWTEKSDRRTVSLVSQRRKKTGLTVVRFIHDIFPVSQPQFTGDPLEHCQSLHEVLTNTDFLLTNSSYTQADVQRFCNRIGMDAPPTQVIRMASRASSTAPTRPVGLDDRMDFILCVGTIEIRKNHHLLFDVWESFIADRPLDRIPTLVIAGSLGWLNTETVSRLRWTPGFTSAVRFIENPTDAELAWMYSNCMFTVYPSLFEGWGYPITESLDAGKVCVTSNVSSMPEAAEGFGILLDPRDRRAWRETIERLIRNHEELRILESEIRDKHVRVTPADVADDIWNALSPLRSGTPAQLAPRPAKLAGVAR